MEGYKNFHDTAWHEGLDLRESSLQAYGGTVQSNGPRDMPASEVVNRKRLKWQKLPPGLPVGHCAV